MFSMFGRTGAPRKMGPPHEDQKNFCNVPTYRNFPKVIEVLNKQWRQVHIGANGAKLTLMPCADVGYVTIKNPPRPAANINREKNTYRII